MNSVLNHLEGPTEHTPKPDALEYDIRLGWIPRAQITGPIPIAFSH
jgi:hypothetical protein